MTLADASMGDGVGALPPDEAGPYWKSSIWWRRTGKAAAGTVASNALSLIATILVARALGPAGYGVVVFAISVTTFVAVLLDVTLEEGIVHFGSRALLAKDLGMLRTILSTGLRVDALIGLGVSVLLIGIAGPLAETLGRSSLDPDLIRLAALTPLLATVNGTTGATLILARRPDLHQACATITAALRLTAVSVVLLAGGGPHAVVAAFAIGSGLGSAVQAALAWRVGWRRWKAEMPGEGATTTPQRAFVRSLLTFGVYSSISSTVMVGTSNLVPIVLGALSGPTAVGLLDIALLPTTVAATATVPIRLAILPEQARLWAANALDVLRRSARGYVVIAMFVGAVGAIIGWFLLPLLIPLLYSDRFEGAILPARILVIAAWGGLISGWAKSLPAAAGKPRNRTVVSAVEMVVSVGLVALLSQYGATGAAIAISVASVVVLGIWLGVARRLLTSPAE